MTIQERIDLATNMAKVTKEDKFLNAILHHYLGTLLSIQVHQNSESFEILAQKLEESMVFALKQSANEFYTDFGGVS